MNPVVLIDEIDKVGADWRGDPASALLEVLDPAQNHTFRDHYLEVDLDLSDILFLTTANVLDTIPAPLLDRMEVVALDGYTEDEKVAIARNHLLPRQRERNGLTADELDVTDDALQGDRRGLDAGSRGARPRTAARAPLPRKAARARSPSGPHEPMQPSAVVIDEAGVARRARTSEVPRRRRDPRRRFPVWRPGSRSRAPAATCSRSRRPRWTASRR